MTRSELLARYPNASADFLQRNADPETVAPLPHPVPKPVVRKSAQIKNEGKERSPVGPRFRVTITSYRCRLLDADNLCPKFFIDALRYKHLIPDDSPDHIILEVRQQKVDSKPQEGTLVEIWHV